jgi:hypothetical protein
MSAALLLLLLACGEDSRDSSPAPRGDSEPEAPCEPPVRNDTPLTAYPSGFVSYGDGSVNRVAAVPVDPSQHDHTIESCQDNPPQWGGTCWTDADCGDPARARCVNQQNEFGSWCECITLCSRDSDCDEGKICIWPNARRSQYRWATCVRAGCVTGADCASGECGVAAKDYQSEHYIRLACRTPNDACRTHADCEESGDGNLCSPGGDDGWHCDWWHPID